MQVQLCCEMCFFLYVLHYTSTDMEKLIHLRVKDKNVLAILSGIFGLTSSPMSNILPFAKSQTLISSL